MGATYRITRAFWLTVRAGAEVECCGEGWVLSEGGPPLSRRRLNAKLLAIEVVRSAREGKGACDSETEEIRAMMGATYRIIRALSVVARAGEQVGGFGGWVGRRVEEVGEKGRRRWTEAFASESAIILAIPTPRPSCNY
jgi:hypothetical protein